jgi:nucleoside-diphosphate-sugar epimerase
MHNVTDRQQNYIAGLMDTILVTGAAGFIGRHVVGELIEKGFSDIRCLVRETSDIKRLAQIIQEKGGNGKATIVQGNLLSLDDCLKATKSVKLIYHLAAGTGTKSFSEAYLNSVITTRNLIEAALHHRCLKRFVNVSSFAVYANRGKKTGRVLDETCPVETSPETRAEAYCYGKVKQDELVMDYGKRSGLPYVIVRPGTVYGPGKKFIPGRVGIDTFGIFLHFGGSNPLPLSYVENCAEAVVLAGLTRGIEGEVFNVIDDDLPTSRNFLRQYKNSVGNIKSIYVPKVISFLFCWGWEKLSTWSRGQLPPVFTRREWIAYWEKTYYDNGKIKAILDWRPEVQTGDGLRKFFEFCKT